VDLLDETKLTVRQCLDATATTALPFRSEGASADFVIESTVFA